MGILPALQRILASLGIQTDITTFLVVFGLAFARLGSAIVLAPFLGGQSVPGKVKVGLAAVLTALIYPMLPVRAGGQELGPIVTVALLVKEIMIGATLGLIAQLVFFGVQMAGTLIDTGRGMNQFTFFVPQLEGNSSILALLQFQAALVLFLVMDGHLLFIQALHRSFELLPLTGFPAMPGGGLALAEQMARITAGMFVVALQMSAPVLIALFLVDVCFGVIGRMASQFQVHSESQPVKALAGLAVLFLSAGFLLDRLTQYLGQLIQHVYAVVRALV